MKGRAHCDIPAAGASRLPGAAQGASGAESTVCGSQAERPHQAAGKRGAGASVPFLLSLPWCRCGLGVRDGHWCTEPRAHAVARQLHRLRRGTSRVLSWAVPAALPVVALWTQPAGWEARLQQFLCIFQNGAYPVRIFTLLSPLHLPIPMFLSECLSRNSLDHHVKLTKVKS